MAVKYNNDTVGPEGLCPTLLVLGSIPRLPLHVPAETQIQRAIAIDAATDAAMKELAKRKISFGIRNTGSPKMKEQEEELTRLPAGAPVLIYRDTSKVCKGPFLFISIDGIAIVIQLPHGRQIFKSTAVKPSNRPVMDKLLQPSSILPQSDNQIQTIQANNSDVSEQINPIMNSYDFRDSIDAELRGLLEMGVFSVVRRDSVPPGTRVYGTR